MSMCSSPGCSCYGDSLLDVRCLCQEDQTLIIGLNSRVSYSNEPPTTAQSLLVENCHHVELHSRIFNHMKNIQNVTIRNCHSLVVHPKLYEGVRTVKKKMNTIEFSNIDKLKVKRYSFKDLDITNRLYLGEVRRATVVSMAFDLHYVKEFSIFASKFDRISMFGIKFNSSKEFNVLGMTYFGTLAAHAIKVKTD